ncbi:MAG: MgtC/SapB family protein [Lachnospiraceae bacterium]|nr:MgtC/SapB family protein [Lachnospiraceae bacterium]
MFFTGFSEWTGLNVLIRIVVSLVIGTVIGIDRGAKRRGGGARTTISVCLGATMVMLLEQYMEQIYGSDVDITRIAAQVVSGVGFLGAGSILVSGHQIKGLTSAASIWTCACIGLAIGIGFLDGAVILTLFWLAGIHVAPFIESRIYRHLRYMTIYIELEDGKAINAVSRKLKEDHCRIDTFNVDKPKAKGQQYQVTTTFCVQRGVNKEEYLRSLQEMTGVSSISEV